MVTKNDLLKLREKMRKRRPLFRRNEAATRKLLSRTGWRRPVGFHSKMRQYHKGKGARVNIGFKVPSEVRGLHNSGKEFLYVTNLTELANADSSKHILIISAQIGMKKKLVIVQEAVKRKIEIQNLDPEQFQKKVQEDIKSRKEKHKTNKARKEKKVKKEKKTKASKKDIATEVKDDKSQ